MASHHPDYLIPTNVDELKPGDQISLTGLDTLTVDRVGKSSRGGDFALLIATDHLHGVLMMTVDTFAKFNRVNS